MLFKYIGNDSWSRPVYEGEDGTLLVDVSPVTHRPMELCTKYNNSFNGEPDTPIEYIDRYRDAEITVDKRVTWY